MTAPCPSHSAKRFGAPITALFTALIAALVAALAGCTAPPAAPRPSPASPPAASAPAVQTAQPLALANPASVACVKAGGQLLIERSAAGERGICLLPGGLRCDEWAWFREEPQACCTTGEAPAGSTIPACRPGTQVGPIKRPS